MPGNENEEFEFRLRAEKEGKPAQVTANTSSAAAPPAEPRLSERIGDMVDSGPSALPGMPGGNFGLPPEAQHHAGRAAALSLDSMVQAIRQYVPGMDHEAATKAAKEIAGKQDKLDTGDRIGGELLAGMVPGGAAGKLATGAKFVKGAAEASKAAKVAQALKTVGAGGATSAALTPVTADTPESGDFATEKAKQFGEGAAATGVLGSALGAGNRIYKAGKEALSPDQRAATVAKAVDAIGTKLGPTRGAATQTAAAGSLKKAETAREAAFLDHAKDARLDPTPIPTDKAADTLERAAHSDTAEGKRLYESILSEIHTPGTTPSSRTPELQSHRLENVRQQIKKAISQGVDGQPIGQHRAAVLNQALKELDESAGTAIPKWKQAFDAFKAKSPEVDKFSRNSGATAGAATAAAGKRGGFDEKFSAPSREVIDGYLKKGPAGMKAAADATAKSPRARTEIRTHVVNDLLNKGGNVTNAWKAQEADLVKSGLFTTAQAQDVGKVIGEYNRVMTVGDGGKPTSVLGAVMGAMLKVPGLSKVMKAGKALNDQADGGAVKKAHDLIVRATLDPQYGKVLLATPTPQNVQAALSAMQRAGAVTAGQTATAEVSAP